MLASKEHSTEQFNQFRPMIEGFVWSAYRMWKGLEREDIQSQAYLIFCEALERYEPEKASFSTFLYNRLKTIDDYCLAMVRRSHYSLEAFEEDADDGESNPIEEAYASNDRYYKRFLEVMDNMDSLMLLSDDAKYILGFITGRVWHIPGAHQYRPTFNSVYRWMRFERNWMPKRMKDAWDEVHQWWMEGNRYEVSIELAI